MGSPPKRQLGRMRHRHIAGDRGSVTDCHLVGVGSDPSATKPAVGYQPIDPAQRRQGKKLIFVWIVESWHPTPSPSAASGAFSVGWSSSLVSRANASETFGFDFDRGLNSRVRECALLLLEVCILDTRSSGGAIRKCK